MDSEQLKKKHPEIYIEFASNADAMYKAPHSISILWWTACALGWFVLEQKIPLHCYLSLKKTDFGAITFGKYIRYNVDCKRFEELSFNKFETPGDTFLQALQKAYPDASYELSILNESSNRTPDTITFLSVIWLERHECNDFSMEKFSIEKEMPYESKHVRELIRKTEMIRLEYNESTLGLSSMSSIYCALHNWSYAIIHRAETQLPLPRKDEIINFSQSGKRRFLGTKLENLAWGVWRLPFEIIIAAPRTTEKNSHWYWELANNVLWAEGISSEIDYATLASWDSLSKKSSLKEGIEMIVDCSNMLNLNAINSIRKYSEWKIVESELFWSLNKAHEGSKYLLGKSNYENARIEAELNWILQRSVRKFTDWNYAIFRTGSSIDMNYVILLSRKIPFEAMNSMTMGLEEEIGQHFNIVYSSINDKCSDLEIRTLRTNELVGGNWWEYIEITRLWVQNKQYSSSSMSDFLSYTQGIVIDSDTWKIYANWTRATSKDIPSQQFTAEIFVRLAKDWCVRSKKLPHSTYSTSKNETISKILSPFRRFHKQNTGNEIEWHVDWTENDFQIKLKNAIVNDVCVIRKIQND